MRGADEAEQWFTACYGEYADAIFRFCLAKTSNRDVALDLSQESFTKLWDHVRGGSRDIGNPRAFLFTIARNTVTDYWRKKKTDALDPMLEAGAEPAAPDATPLEAEYREALALIDTLDEPYREAVYLRHVEELPPRDIADILGEEVNTVSIRITRGMKQLRERLGRGPSAQEP